MHWGTTKCRRPTSTGWLPKGGVPARRNPRVLPVDMAPRAPRLVPGLAMACVVSGHVADQQTEFFKTAGTNLGVHVDFFKSRAEALRWLGVESAST